MKRNLKLTVGTWVIEVEQSVERKSKNIGNIITIYQKDAMTSQCPIQYEDGKIAYDFPNIVPQYVKDFLNDNMWELYNVNLQLTPLG
jgi:hypothetical protein